MDEFKPIVHTYTTPKYLTVNVYMVETEHGVVLVDGATALSTSREIRGIIDDTIKKPLLAVLLTHGHPDHYVGIGEIVRGLDVPILATQGAIDFAMEQDRHKFDSLITRNYGTDAPAQRVFPNQAVRDGQTFKFDGLAFRVQDMGPCESDSDTLWIAELDGVKHVFLGDIIYSHMHSYLRDGHATNWVAALDNLVDEFDHTTVFHPGHGETCGTEMAYWQKAYIEAFRCTLRSMLDGRNSLDDAQKEALIGHMKSFLPSDKLLMLLKYELDETIRLLGKVHEGEHVLLSRAA